MPPVPDDDEAVADEILLKELRRVVNVADPVPAGWAVTAQAAYSWRGLAGRPARLVYDSRSDRRPVDGCVRGAEAQRTLRFAAGGCVTAAGVELALTVGSGSLSVCGRLRPGRSATVTHLSGDDRTVARTTVAGVFALDELPVRPFCLLVDGDDGLKTGWVAV